MKRALIALIAFVTMVTPVSFALAASSAPTVIAERVLHTPSRTDEAVRLISSEPTYFEMLYCEGQSIPSDPYAAGCTWIVDEEWQTGYHYSNTVLMTNLTPYEFYAYRIQLVAESGRGVVTEGVFYNR